MLKMTLSGPMQYLERPAFQGQTWEIRIAGQRFDGRVVRWDAQMRVEHGNYWGGRDEVLDLCRGPEVIAEFYLLPLGSTVTKDSTLSTTDRKEMQAEIERLLRLNSELKKCARTRADDNRLKAFETLKAENAMHAQQAEDALRRVAVLTTERDKLVAELARYSPTLPADATRFNLLETD